MISFGDRDWSDVSLKPKYAQDCSRRQKLRKKLGMISHSELSDGTNPTEILIVDFRPPEL